MHYGEQTDGLWDPPRICDPAGYWPDDKIGTERKSQIEAGADWQKRSDLSRWLTGANTTLVQQSCFVAMDERTRLHVVMDLLLNEDWHLTDTESLGRRHVTWAPDRAVTSRANLAESALCVTVLSAHKHCAINTYSSIWKQTCLTFSDSGCSCKLVSGC